ncbi:hypothetical protein M4I32_11060 [Microbacterium sp. LRZ72]|uniref:hypothetical protein n=1 Tax=Microbacterium sp. LRZ72 TaxID=2942481 RepID=UPI0029B8CEFF|nr:hypothetical protein [Microbacterium sp. LRZ72]MDX2377338.1 hypothetical protein [Microbacterium sp. LRZ72]
MSAADRVEVTALLRLTEWPAYMVFALFTLTNAVNAFATLDEVVAPAVAVAALALVSAGGLLLLLPAPEPYPASRTAIVLGATTLVSLAAWNLPEDVRPGWAAWFWGAVAVLLMVLAFRGRIIAAWAGLAVMMLIAVVWAVGAGWSAFDGLVFTIRHAAMLLVGTVFALYLRRTAAAIGALQRTELARARDQEATRAARDEQRARIERLRSLAEPALRHLASDEPIDDDARREFRLLEATLRDWLRADALSTSTVLAAARRARERGVDVTLLDDRGPGAMDAATAARVERMVVSILDAHAAGEIVVRILPAGRDPAATIRGTGTGGPVRVDIPAAPDPQEPARRA